MTGQHALANEAIPRYAPDVSDTEQAAMDRDYLGFLSDVAEQCGDIGQYQRRGAPVVLVNTPELARALLVDKAGDLTKGDLQRTAFRALLGESVSMSEGDRHDRLRRLLAPLLSHRLITRHAERIVQTAESACVGWPDLAEIDLFDELHRLTLHTLGPVLVAEPTLWVETEPFWRARERLWLWINDTTSERRGLTDHAADALDSQVAVDIKTAQDAVDRVIRARQQFGTGPDDLLMDVLDSNAGLAEPFHPSEVRDQIIALLFAAHETSAAALFWSLYLLAGHPDVRARVEQEIESTLGGRIPEALDLPALPLTFQVVKEAMRLYPPAARQFRVAARDTTLAGYPVVRGTAVSVCQYILHRSPEVFPNPDRFIPDRFAPGAPLRPPLSYLPFGAGERTCLGRHYAMQETHLLMAVLVSHFRFTFPDSVPLRLAVTLRPNAEVRVLVHRRDHHRAGPTGSGHRRADT